MIAALRYSHGRKAEWDRFISVAKNGLFIFLRDYMDYHSDRFADASLMLYQDERLVAVMPAHLRDDLWSSHEGLTFGGMVYADDMRAASMLELMDHACRFALALGARSMAYKAIPYPFWQGPSQEDLYALHRCGATLARRDLSSVVQLRRRPALAKGRQHGLTKAKRAGLTVSADAPFASFMPILEGALAHHNARPAHKLAELELLSARFPGRIRLATAIDRNGTPIAGAVVYDYGSIVHTQYLASSDAGRQTGALDLVIAHLLDDAGASGKEFFSFGASTEQQGRVLNQGLSAQKEMFGGRAIVLDHYQVDLCRLPPSAVPNGAT